jgi:hypothetical protein
MGRLKEALSPEFNSVEELDAHYAALRERLYGKKAMPLVAIVRPAPETSARTIYACPIGPQRMFGRRDKLHIRSGYSILCEVAEQRGIPVAQIQGKGRTAELTSARKEIYRRFWHETGLSSVGMARLMRRDHTTALFHLTGKKRGKINDA